MIFLKVRNGFSGNDAPTSCPPGKQCLKSAVDPCLLKPCLNGGTCVVGYNQQINCLCPAGFIGK